MPVLSEPVTVANTLLSGVRVLDLSRILAGPWCTQLLADMGAEVLKIEKPGAGDDTRHWGPPFLKGADGRDTTESAYFLGCNRGKKSLAIDFTVAEGQKLLLEMLAHCDILVENYKVGALAKYGLSYAQLSAQFPRLIYCSITGFGQTGPDAAKAGYDAMIQARGGLMSMTGEAQGDPVKVGVAVADLMTGMYAATGLLAALYRRERCGKGEYIDIGLLDTQVAWLANQGMNYLIGGVIPQREGSAHPNIVPYQAFPASDGDFMLAVGNDAQFRAFCRAADCEYLADDPRYASNALRVQQRKELVMLLRQITIKRSQQEWLTALEQVGVPAGAIQNLAQVFDDPQVKERGAVMALPHASGVAVPQMVNPVHLTQAAMSYHTAAPVLGQHTSEVLMSLLRKEADEISLWRQANIIA